MQASAAARWEWTVRHVPTGESGLTGGGCWLILPIFRKSVDSKGGFWLDRGEVKSQKAYAAAGVDIDLGNSLKSTLPALLASTHRKEVMGKVGGFGGLFALDLKKHKQPILVSSVDGVGTKLKLAFAMDQHDTIGEDLVNHCVNDIAVLGAVPLFFLDYLGTGTLKPHVV